ncbi:sterol desaturase family [Hortaea werneckii]|uniref:Fatty acid hydroxylase domain-containing protein n=1 Tax=Hortaea werneckii TaxID=91943 RepID=A0A3M7G607_HORWE|nr:sterol desaturase family [Hortaea werneckii]RMY96074.1 hypothetical protein D0861_00271 [Hortaea werneckii]
MTSLQAVRDQVLYYGGYAQGRYLPHSLAELYGRVVSRLTSIIAIPLPLLSFLALPFFGGSPALVNLVIFGLTWSALVASYDPLTVEFGGTLLVRLVCFLAPALSALVFDCAVPSLAKSIKARGKKQLPTNLGRKKLLEVIVVSVVNVFLAIAVQAALELLTTEVLHLRSNIKVTSLVPLPWTILKDVAKGLALRGVLRYFIHRFLLHTWSTPLKSWHLSWQHSVQLPFSLVATYDHPVVHLLSQWLPVFLPALLFRFHVLTWHVLLAVASFEDLFVYSGYAVLPSSIILAGMARRADSHFAAVRDNKPAGNFGHLGLLDFMLGTTCNDEADVMDDLQSEAQKHRLEERAESAVQGAMSGIKGEQQPSASSSSEEEVSSKREDEVDQAGASADNVSGAANDADMDADKDADEDTQQPGQRRSNRRKARKA